MIGGGNRVEQRLHLWLNAGQNKVRKQRFALWDLVSSTRRNWSKGSRQRLADGPRYGAQV
ncbi:unnamed protein product [Prunus armeniaca]|uniref:Uncharacterized protein n=1 Tax=Prunus armeniaca TaxID=36596 RepID=A0A6J5WTN7_PRUAR|nr:unnamed protein product [Prunus armeniaca]